MSVDAEAGRLKTEADEPGWEVDPDDEWGVAVAEKSLQRRWRGREGVRFVLETSQEQAKGGFVVH